MERLDYLGYRLNQFMAIDSEKPVRLVVKTWGRGRDKTVTLCADYNPDSSVSMYSNLMDDDDYDNKEYYEELAKEYNDQVTQESWDEYRKQALKEVYKYRMEEKTELNVKINKLRDMMKELE